jgi:hypothetical protein
LHKFLDVAVRGQGLGTNRQDYQQGKESRPLLFAKRKT